jgi:hypothetical protein
VDECGFGEEVLFGDEPECFERGVVVVGDPVEDALAGEVPVGIGG